MYDVCICIYICMVSAMYGYGHVWLQPCIVTAMYVLLQPCTVMAMYGYSHVCIVTAMYVLLQPLTVMAMFYIHV